jgi:hypothetical protein
MSEFGREEAAMDRDTLQDDLDLILELSRDDKLPGEWDWEPPLGMGAPAASSAAEPRATDATGTDPSSEEATDPLDGPEDEAKDEAGDEGEGEEEEDD